MVERRAGPVRGAVAQRAILREARCCMTRVRRRSVFCQVTRIACCRQCCVLPTRMTLLASQSRMLSRQREFELRVIKCRIGPVRRCMARFASCRERSCNVVRHRSAQCCSRVEIGLMATDAGGRLC